MAEHRINKVHFIGIGGVGMSGIARVAKEKGMEVSGSDLRESRYTQQLREAGVKIFIGQSASNLEGLDPDVVVVLPCVPATANVSWPTPSAASILARCQMGKLRFFASMNSALFSRIAVETTTTSGSSPSRLDAL